MQHLRFTSSLVVVGFLACTLWNRSERAASGPLEQASRKLQVLTLEGTPHQRGLAHGKTMKEQIHQVLKLWKADLTKSLKMDADEFITLFVKKTDFLSAMKKWTPALVQEIEGIAEGAGVDFNTIYVFQLPDEVWANAQTLVGERCSSLGFSRRGTQPAYIAQNLDIDTFYDGFQMVLHIKHQGSDLESFVLSVPGLIGLNGMNNKSIGICCNTLLQLNSCRDGLPVACVLRGVLEQKNAKDAIKFLREIKHASGQNYILGSFAEAYDFECSATQVTQFTPKGPEGVVWHTNHPLVNNDFTAKYRSYLEKKDTLAKMEANTRTRLECLQMRLTKDMPVDVDLIKATMASRDSEKFPVSRPKGKNLAFTYASTIMVLSAAPEFHVSPGPPGDAAYEKLSFSKRAK